MSDIIAFSHKYKLHKLTASEFIIHIENIALFGIGILVFLADLYYCYNNKDINAQWPFLTIMKIAGGFSIFDLFFTKSNDIKIHHLFMMVIIYF